ncbi:hypothetical protein ACJX0J_034020, partial [Zea mays]
KILQIIHLGWIQMIIDNTYPWTIMTDKQKRLILGNMEKMKEMAPNNWCDILLNNNCEIEMPILSMLEKIKTSKHLLCTINRIDKTTKIKEETTSRRSEHKCFHALQEKQEEENIRTSSTQTLLTQLMDFSEINSSLVFTD